MVGIALAGIGAGSTTGAFVMTAGVLIVRYMQASGTATPEFGGTVLTATLFGGIVAAVGSAWIATGSLDDTWRRGIASGSAVLGAALLAIGATVADQFAGLAGLGGYGVLLLLGAVVTHLAATRWSRA